MLSDSDPLNNMLNHVLSFRTICHSQIADAVAHVQAGSLHCHTYEVSCTSSTCSTGTDDHRDNTEKSSYRALHEDYVRTDLHTLNMI